MLSSIGLILIFCILTLSLLIVYNAYLDININSQKIKKSIYKLSLFQITFTILSFLTLILGFVYSDFSIVNVYENSHTDKPLFYKIAGTWGNHEGSLLLWINILVLFNYLFLIFNHEHDKKFRLYTLIFQNFLILGFVFFLLLNSNPFSSIYPIPTEGLGLNPILQDPALAIHPPLLYIGFVGCSIYFSAAIGSILSVYNGKQFALSIKSWVQISWVFQTLGITIGSIWAYYELGWGGFWFWDPVENASLLPWFAISALMHSIMVLEKRNILYEWVIILCLLTFILSVTGTFLVRSGILNSVHTFANDPSRGAYILLFLSIMIFTSLIIFFKKRRPETYNFNFNSKETFILTNNWFMVFFLVTVLIGTLYPIFLDVLSDIKVSVGPPFYNIVIIPLVIPFLVFMAIGPQLKWINSQKQKLYRTMFILLGALIINLLTFYFFKNYGIYSNLILIAATFLIMHSILDAKKSIKNKKKFEYPRIISHLGFGLLVLFIGINHQHSVEMNFNLKVGEKRKLSNFELYFENVKIEQNKNYKSVVGIFQIKELKNGSTQYLNPEIRIYTNPETLTYEAAIKSKITSDLYLTMSNISRSDYYNIKFQNKPFMMWVWISAFMIALGGFVQLTLKRNEN
jgi:cytochrome c-type biogenesis protein CcmF|tara:strand:- start:3600 stop:5486 length:1887 start_codon:yes stop_codon:yes gene_type:complete